MPIAAEGVVGDGDGQLTDRADVAGGDGVSGDVLLAADEEDVADPLAVVLGGVVQVAVAVDGATEDPEVGDTADVGVGDGLEDEGGERGVGRGLEVAVAVGVDATGGGRQVLDDAVEELLDANAAGGGAAEDGNQLPLVDAAAEDGDQVLGGQLLVVEVADREVLVELGDGLDQLAAVGLDGLRVLGRDVDLLGWFAGLGRAVGPSAENMITPVNDFSAPIGTWIGAMPEPRLDFSDSMVAAKSAFSRSILLTNTKRADPFSRARSAARSVPTSTPAEASTTSTADSTTRSAAQTSPTKSA
jgi:hypothetical protein